MIEILVIGTYNAWFQLISHVFQMLTIINRDITFKLFSYCTHTNNKNLKIE